MPQALTTEEIDLAELKIIEALHANPRLTTKQAVEQSGLSRTTFYRLLANRKGFRERIRAAQKHSRQAAVDSIEEAMYERAIDVRNPVGTTAGIFLLKGLKPETYGERQPRTAPVAVNFFFDGAEQLRIERDADADLKALEGERQDGAVELEPDTSDAWAVKQ